MKVFFTLSFSLICFYLQSQVNKEYQSFGLSEEIEILSMPLQNNALLIQTELRSRKKGRPDCFAKSLRADIDPHRSGTWDFTNKGIGVWRQKIISKGAKTINLGFSKFLMPEGGKLFIIGKDQGSVMGPFTPSDNEEHGQLWTPVVEGDELTVEIQIPMNQIEKLEILLDHVNHDFLDILKSNNSSSSGSCNIDVVCGAEDGFPVIDTKRDIINSVGAFTLNGIEQCSGVLINNARNDCAPYFLTANHCEVTNSNAASVVVYWNYENTVCRPPETVESGRDGDGDRTQFNTGSTFVSGYAPSDFTLLLLDDEVSPEYTPYFAGWNIKRELPDSSICIHHPNVEEKRISFDYDSNVISVDAANDTFIRVEAWELGTTEGGSSGAPLFNYSNEVIGLLNSGLATCNNSLYDDFGPLFLSWDGGGTPETRLKDWLDPDDLGLAFLAGKNCTITLNLEESQIEVCGVDTDTKKVNFIVNENFEQEVSLSASNLPDGLVIDFEREKLSPGSSSNFTISNISTLTPGTYQIELIADDGSNVGVSSLALKVFSSSGESINVITPSNGSIGELTNTFLSWSTQSKEVDIDLSTDADFTDIVYDAKGLNESSITVKDLMPGTKYFWRLRARNICGVGDWSSLAEFTTGQVFCSDEFQNNEQVEIPDSQSATILSTINVNLSGIVRNVQITNVVGQHTWIGDLSMNLISPSGTVVNLIEFICEDADDFSIGFSDDQGAENVPCPLTDERLYQPNGNFSSFDGELAAGPWQLQIIDVATLDGGQLNQWGIEICTEISTEAIIYIGNNDINTCGDATATISVGLGLGFNGDVTLSVDASDLIMVQLEETLVKNGEVTNLLISNLDETPSGMYQITVNATDGDKNATEIIELQVSRPIDMISLNKPENDEINTPVVPLLEWQRNGNDDSYFVQLSTSSDFSSVFYDSILVTNNLQIEEDVLMGNTDYYWRVAAANSCNSFLSDTYTFRTEFVDATFQLDDVIIEIFPNPASTDISLSSNSSLSSDLNLSLYNIRGQLILKDQMRAGTLNFKINVDNLESGLYFLKVKGGTAQHTEKIVINN